MSTPTVSILIYFYFNKYKSFVFLVGSTKTLYVDITLFFENPPQKYYIYYLVLVTIPYADKDFLQILIQST